MPCEWSCCFDSICRSVSNTEKKNKHRKKRSETKDTCVHLKKKLHVHKIFGYSSGFLWSSTVQGKSKVHTASPLMVAYILLRHSIGHFRKRTETHMLRGGDAQCGDVAVTSG